MDEVKRKVYLDLFASPWNLIPLAGGLTSFMAAWAVGGSPELLMLGTAGVLAGMGVTASRLIFGLEDLTEKAYQYQLEQKRAEQEEGLRVLFEKLQQDRDPRTESCLLELQTLYRSLQTAGKNNKINTSSFEVIDGVSQLFEQCIKQLEHSHALWELSQRLRGSARESLLQQRDEVVREVCLTVDDVAKKVDHFLLSETRRNRSELSRVRQELNESIEAARRAEQRTAELERVARREASQTES